MKRDLAQPLSLDWSALVEDAAREVSLVQKSDAVEAVQQAIARRSEERRSLQQPRSWQMSFGPIDGLTGEVKEVSCTPRCLFKSEIMIAGSYAIPNATDNAWTNMPGAAIIESVQCGMAFIEGFPRSTSDFVDSDLQITKQPVQFTCNPAFSINMRVRFLEKCLVVIGLFGKAIL